MESKQLISIKINLGSYQYFIDQITEIAKAGKSAYVSVANVHMSIEAYKDPSFADIVNNSIMVTPDGIPLTWGLRLLYGIRQNRVAGMDLLPDLLSAAEKKNIAIGFYGGTQDMLIRAEKVLKERFPKLSVPQMYSPPFRSLTTDEDLYVIKMFNESGARIIFVALGCPKQERWMASMNGKIEALMIGIGGALPVLVGLQRRAPLWMQHMGFEWLYRLGQEPKRLFKRYAVSNLIFIYLILKKKASLKYQSQK